MTIEQRVYAAMDEAALGAFEARVRGELIRPDDAEYDAARRVYNAMIDKHPALIVRCADVADVISAVTFAREQGLTVSVRGGGHNVAGFAVNDGGLVIDLSPMKGIHVDPARRTATAQPGLTLGELDRATQTHGLAVPLGIISMTGIAGLTLGGGIGWLNGKYGLACDNVLAAEVVTADGRLLTASAAEHADLFWGLRGGGGNFGVVTSFTYQLHPVGPVLGGVVTYPAAKAREALRFYHEFASACPDELSTMASVSAGPDGRPMVGVVVCYCGSIAAGEQAVRPLRAFGPPVTDDIGPMAYCALQSQLDGGFPRDRQHYWKGGRLARLGDEAIETLLDVVAQDPPPPYGIGLQQVHGAASRVDPAATAFPHRGRWYDFLILAQWADPAASDGNVQRTRALFAAMQPFLERGVYVNNLGTEEDERVRAAYGANYERLVALKNAYDPTNLFHLNQNIKPTTSRDIRLLEQQGGEDMSTEENKAKLSRIYDECFNQGILATADELVSSDAQGISTGTPLDSPTTVADALKAAVPLLRTAFPDLCVTADEIIAEGDAVAARSTWTGTHHGEFMGIPPTGKYVSWSTMELFHVRDGKFVSRFGIPDAMSLMQQLGAIPSAGPAGG